MLFYRMQGSSGLSSTVSGEREDEETEVCGCVSNFDELSVEITEGCCVDRRYV